MIRLFILFFVLVSYKGYGQKKTFLEFQIGGIKTIPQSGFIESDKVSLDGGKITPSISALVAHSIINPSLYVITGLNFSFKNARIQQNIDTLAYTGIVYTQPQYRIISIPLLVGFQKTIDINFNPIAERKRVISIATGVSVDFVKESRIKNGMSIKGKGFSVKTSYKNNYAFISNTGISFNFSLSFSILQFKNGNNINLLVAYKYPFYIQNSLKVDYKINDDNKNYEVSKLRLQEVSIGLTTRFYK